MGKKKGGIDMSLTLQIILIVVSILSFLFMCSKIRKAQMNLEDTIFWSIFDIWLILFSVFPSIPSFFARLIGIESTVNFLFLSIIFILLVKLFYLTLKVSKLENKIKSLTQDIALERMQKKADMKEHKNSEESYV